MAGWAKAIHTYMAFRHPVLHVWASWDAQPHKYEGTAVPPKAGIGGGHNMSLILRMRCLSRKGCLKGCRS